MQNGRRSAGGLPSGFGNAQLSLYGNVEVASESLKPLCTNVTTAELLSARKAIHNHLWGGGGASYTDVYRIIVELVLCRHHDECTTRKGAAYVFQQRQGESAAVLAERMTKLCRDAAKAVGTTIDAPFDKVIQSPEKLAHAIREFAGFSFTSNALSSEADILGDFFEATLGTEFKQSKGQFFTHKHIASFALRLAGLGGSAAKAFEQQGPPRWPRIIDPSCGSGTFLVEALRQVRDSARAFKAQPGGVQLSPMQEDELRRFDEDSLTHKWTDGRFYGIDAHQDLGLGCKVNMLMHKASAMHISTRDALSKLDPRKVPLGQFDLVASNPPFSVTLSPRERDELKVDYTLLQGRASGSVASEHLFLERWHQLLREGGSVVAVVPESLLDTKTNLQARKFLFQHFNLQAVVSLPSVAFRPYTGTKTVVILAQKKTEAEAALWETAVRDATLLHGTDEEACFRAALQDSAGTSEIFMAEPASVGYKRRANRGDLETEDDLMNDVGESVLSRWNAARNQTPRRQFGFWVPLKDVAARRFLRADPKYMWLWSVNKGVVGFDHAAERCAPVRPLSELLNAYRPASIEKGVLDPPRTYVEAGTPPKTSDMALSEGKKLEFGDSELAINLVTASVIRNAPAEDWIGSASWALFNTTNAVDADFLHGLLKTPCFREATDCISSGLGPGRILPAELLDLQVPLPTMDVQGRQGRKFREDLAEIEQLYEQIRQREKDAVDVFFRSISRSG